GTRAHPLLGERLLQAGRITRDQLHIALHEQRRSGRMLGDILVRLGFLKEEDLSAVLAERTGLTQIDLKKTKIDAALLHLFPKATGKGGRAVAESLKGDILTLAMADPYDVVALDDIRRYFPHPIEVVPYIANPAEIDDAIARHEAIKTPLENILGELETGKSE